MSRRIKLLCVFTLLFSTVLVVNTEKIIIDLMDKAYSEDIDNLKEYSIDSMYPIECPYASLEKTTAADGVVTQEINTDCLLDSEKYGYHSIRMIRNLSDKTVKAKNTYYVNDLIQVELTKQTKDFNGLEIKKDIDDFLCKSELKLCQFDSDQKCWYTWTYDSEIKIRKFIVFCDYINSQISKTYKLIYSWYVEGFSSLRFLEERNTSVRSFYIKEYEKISYLDYEKSFKKYNYDKTKSTYTLNQAISDFSAEIKKILLKVEAIRCRSTFMHQNI